MRFFLVKNKNLFLFLLFCCSLATTIPSYAQYDEDGRPRGYERESPPEYGRRAERPRGGRTQPTQRSEDPYDYEQGNYGSRHNDSMGGFKQKHEDTFSLLPPDADGVVKEITPSTDPEKFGSQMKGGALPNMPNMPQEQQKEKEKEKAEEPKEEEKEPEPQELFITLPPNDMKAMIPNVEHIPYFFSEVKVFADGTIGVVETIKIVSKGNIVKHGISRLFPHAYINRLGQKVSNNIKVISVTKDGEAEKFELKRNSDGLMIETGDPKVLLASGIHTYEIYYLAYNQISMQENFDEIFWNITSSNWGLHSYRVGARFVLPFGAKPILQGGVSLKKGSDGTDFVVLQDDDGNLVYGATSSFGAGEGLIASISWEKGFIIAPTLNQKIATFLRNNGTEAATATGLAFTFLSYLISWIWFKKRHHKKNTKISPKPPEGITPTSIRYLFFRVLDTKNLVCLLLSMAEKGFFHIKEDENSKISIIKRTDDTSLLSLTEKNVGSILFSNKATSFAVDKQNALPLTRSLSKIEDDILYEYEKQCFKYNWLYLFAGGGMFATTLAAVAFLSVSPLYTGILSAWVGILLILTSFFLISAYLSFKNHFFNTSKQTKTRSARLKAGRNLASKQKSTSNKISTLKSKHLSKGILLLLSALIFSAGCFAGIKLYSAATSNLTAMLLPFIPLSIGAFYNLFKTPTAIGHMIIEKIEGYKNYLQIDGNITPPITKEAAQKNQPIINTHLPYALALNLEKKWVEKFKPIEGTTGLDNISYKPFWYSGERTFDLKTFDNDFLELFSNLNKDILESSGVISNIA